MKRAAFVVIGLLLLVVPAVHAADGAPWTPNIEVSEDWGRLEHQTAPDVAVDALGNVTVMWAQHSGNRGIYYNYRPAGGDFGVAWRVPYGGFNSVEPAVAMDNAGNAYGIWMSYYGPPFHWDVVFMYNPPGGDWTSFAGVVNDDGGATDQTHPDIAVDPSGNSYAIWTDRRHGGSDIYFSYRPAAANWGENVRVSDDESGAYKDFSSIAVDAAGNAYAVWIDSRDVDVRGDVYFSYRLSNGTWAPNVPINDAPGSAAGWCAIAADADGNTHAIWAGVRDGHLALFTDYRRDSGAWGPDRLLTNESQIPWNPDLAFDSVGNLHAIWAEGSVAFWDLYYTMRPAGGDWGPVAQVNDLSGSVRVESSSGRPALAAGADGTAYAAWVDARNDDVDIFFAERSPTVDESPPTTLIALNGTAGNSGWFLSPVAVTLGASDDPDGSGVASTEHSLNGGATWNTYTEPFTIVQEGITTVLARSADNAGNLEDPPTSAEVKIDLSPPTETMVTDGTTGNNGWFLSPVGATLWATDGLGGSGVGYSGYSLDGGATWYAYSGPFTISQEGTTTVLMRSGDNAGNIEDPPVSQEVKIDLTPPAIVGTRSPLPNPHGWANSDVAVHFDCADAASGVDLCPPDSILSDEGAGQAVTGTAVDLAGNTATITVGDVNIDKTPPTISGAKWPAPNQNGWNNTDVTVHFDCADTLSGVASCPADTTLSDEGVGQSVTGTTADLAGNTASATVGDINIDLTAPTVHITGLSPNPASVSELIELVALLSDQLSGIQAAEWCAQSESLPCTWQPMTLTGDAGDLFRTASASISALSPGVYSIKVKTEDLADNISDVAHAFLVVYDPSAGFATGGGWIVPGTEPGDFLPGITGQDKANFGFVVKYKKGASTPDGQLEFHYRVGDLNLHSTEMHWMVINNNWAKFQGYATINLHPDQLFYFHVDARDGNLNGGSQKDRFIIKVWYDYQDPNVDDPLYRASGDLTGGNIIIQGQ